MSDGSRLRQSWYSALEGGEAQFKQLLTSPSSEWKRLTLTGSGDGGAASPSSASPTTGSPSSKQKGKGKARVPELSDVVVHRNTSRKYNKAGGGEDVYRMVLDVPTGEDQQISLEPWKAVLTTPELRRVWDPAVEDSHMVEMVDRNTWISKTHYALGWPAKDSVTISRASADTTMLIDITTSLPRSADEPAYLRPSPPFVRSHVQLFAWCIQHIQPQPQLQPFTPTSTTIPAPTRKSSNQFGVLRITCFYQHDLKSLWGFGSSTATLTQQLSTMTLSLLKTVAKRGDRVAKLVGYGNGVSVERVKYQIDREALTVEYAIIPDEIDEEHSSSRFQEVATQVIGMEEVHAMREQRRLTRSVECVLPALEGWDVQVTMKGSSEDVERIPWSALAVRKSSNPLSSSSLSPLQQLQPDQILLRITHGSLTHDDAVLKVRLVLEISGATRGLRLNGLAAKVHDDEDERDPSSYHRVPEKILQDVASAVVDMSFRSGVSASSSSSLAGGGASIASSTASAVSNMPMLRRQQVERSAAAEKSILSKVRRNYIYFSSLLQEPEAKWRRTTEARGVSITQLDSIDPTLVVYRAEATFVGVGLWDLYGAIVSPGARAYWDKQHEDGVLLEDVNELTELWHFKTKPAWPVNGRDAILLKTVYKSPTTIHVFSFSISPSDSSHLFPSTVIPQPSPSTIRTQVDLQGWAIEALSPNTTLLTLLEQSDWKGWSNKATVLPTQMVGTLAGIGEFAIRCGSPPVITRLVGARKNEVRYEHERGVFRVEYEPEIGRESSLGKNAEGTGGMGRDEDGSPAIECEIRCDIDTWAGSLDIVVDPPPQTISCLRRHRLSSSGGGLWLTLTHDAIYGVGFGFRSSKFGGTRHDPEEEDRRLMVVVKRAPGKEKGLVMVNGAKVQVDVEEMNDNEIRSAVRKKRVKPMRIPLDVPPVVGVIKKRREELSVEGLGSGAGEDASDPPASKKNGNGSKNGDSTTNNHNNTWATAPRMSGPLSRFLSYAVDQATSTTQQAVAAIAPASLISGGGSSLDPTKLPMQYALEALAWTQEFYSRPSQSQTALAQGQVQHDGWTLISDKPFPVHRKLIPEISATIPIFRSQKVIEGISAEDLASVVVHPGCRREWDERFVSGDSGGRGSCLLESYGGMARTSWEVVRGGAGGGLGLGLLVSNRGFLVGSVVARGPQVSPSSPSSISVGPNPIFLVSSSFSAESASAKSFDALKYNPASLLIGRVYIDAWILETLDPYGTEKENYAIPSTRCTRLLAVDYAGSVPAALNAAMNATAVGRGLVGVEAYVRRRAAGVMGVGAAVAGSVPVVRLPAPGLVVSERRRIEERGVGVSSNSTAGDSSPGRAIGVGGVIVAAPFMAWTMRKRDENRVLLDAKFEVEKRAFVCCVLVVVGAAKREREASSATMVQGLGSTMTTPRPSIIVDPASRASSGSSSSSGTQESSAELSEGLDTNDKNGRVDDHDAAFDFEDHDSERERDDEGEDGEFDPMSSSQITIRSGDDEPDSSSASRVIGFPPSEPIPFPASALPSSSSPMPLRTRHISTTTTSSISTSTTYGSPHLRHRAVSSGSGTPSKHAIQTYATMSARSKGKGRANAHGPSRNASGSGESSSNSGASLSANTFGGASTSTLHAIASSSAHQTHPSHHPAFTAKGELKLNTDLIVAELVLDARMYGVLEGGNPGQGQGQRKVGYGYKVDVGARRKRTTTKRTGGGATDGAIGLSRIGKGVGDEDGEDRDDAFDDVPFVPTVYTLPASPLHSSAFLAPNVGSLSTSGSASGSASASTSALASTLERKLDAEFGAFISDSKPSASHDLSAVVDTESNLDMDLDLDFEMEQTPIRHLLRLSLPTARYQNRMSGVRDDPLRGRGRDSGSERHKERHKDKDKDDILEEREERPDWMHALEDEGMVVDIVVRPVEKSDIEASAAASITDDGDETLHHHHQSRSRSRHGRGQQIGLKKGTGKPKGKSNFLILFNGTHVVSVHDEKEALTLLGRDELVDDRVGRMGVVSRTPKDTDTGPLPEELRVPIAVADDLLVSPSSSSTNVNTTLDNSTDAQATPSKNQGGNDKESKDPSRRSSPFPGAAKDPKDVGVLVQGRPVGDSKGAGSGSARGARDEKEKGEREKEKGDHRVRVAEKEGGFGVHGLLKWISFGTDPSPRVSSDSTGDRDNDMHDSGNDLYPKTSLETKSGRLPGGIGDVLEDGETTSSNNTETKVEGSGRDSRSGYSLSTVVLVGLIAFLIGSLLRSMLSPADFMYDGPGAVVGQEEGRGGSGSRRWREMKRLVEIKYVYGGWDFQVAVVRRHDED